MFVAFVQLQYEDHWIINPIGSKLSLFLDSNIMPHWWRHKVSADIVIVGAVRIRCPAWRSFLPGERRETFFSCGQNANSYGNLS